MEAINLYLKAGLPAKAARLAMSREVRPSGVCIVSRVKKGQAFEGVGSGHVIQEINSRGKEGRLTIFGVNQGIFFFKYPLV